MASPSRMEGPGKISQALIELAKPLVEDIDENDLREYEYVIKIAAAAWNYAVMEAEGCSMRQAIEEAAAKLDPERATELRSVMGMLIARKQAMFPDDDRFVGGVSVSDTGEGFHVMAASIRESPGAGPRRAFP